MLIYYFTCATASITHRNMNFALPLTNHELLGSVVLTHHRSMTSQSSEVEMHLRVKNIETKMHFTFNLKKEKNSLQIVAISASQAKLWWRKMSIPLGSRISWHGRKIARKHFTGGSRASIFLDIASAMVLLPKVGWISTRWLWRQQLALSSMITRMATLLLKFVNHISIAVHLDYLHS